MTEPRSIRVRVAVVAASFPNLVTSEVARDVVRLRMTPLPRGFLLFGTNSSIGPSSTPYNPRTAPDERRHKTEPGPTASHAPKELLPPAVLETGKDIDASMQQLPLPATEATLYRRGGYAG